MSQLMQNMQLQFKKTSNSLLVLSLKTLSGLFVGLTLALGLQQALHFGDFSFWFTLFLGAGVFLRLSRGLGVAGVLIFDLIFFLVLLLLRMYVLVAPGA